MGAEPSADFRQQLRQIAAVNAVAGGMDPTAALAIANPPGTLSLGPATGGALTVGAATLGPVATGGAAGVGSDFVGPMPYTLPDGSGSLTPPAGDNLVQANAPTGNAPQNPTVTISGGSTGGTLTGGYFQDAGGPSELQPGAGGSTDAPPAAAGGEIGVAVAGAVALVALLAYLAG